ncbi:hypothetical protein amrb99_62040 [Actinomadura sp. RB99]|uniref:hypothetical protein n=1 Tax=Actinomadura sp. RB99 TaxID=2691577 RepID=UPI00168973E8|nr:hypothetical protein [Actinomadura sp. RB99]MBD2897245.1 hypothetical protein [Actinomadura sp. RB99]
MTAAEDVGDLVDEMGRAFPGWTVVEVGGRWFAARGPLNGEQLPAGALEADSPAALYLQLEARRR